MKKYNCYEELKNDVSFNFPMEIEVEGECFHLHHVSLSRGYQTTKANKIENYTGRFGDGIKISTWYNNSNRYHNLGYYVK